MSLTNTETRYGVVTKTLHWAIALGILVMIPLGFLANDAAYETAGQLAFKATLFSLHKTLGVTLFFIALARILWALSQPKPAPLHPERRLETTLAEIVHWVLYGSLVLVPLSGWMHHAATDGFAPIWWPFGQDLPLVPKDPGLAEVLGSSHIILQWVLIVALGLHVLGALKHHIIDRDATLRRMLPGNTDAGAPAARNPGRLAPLGALAIWGVAFGIGSALGMFEHQGSALPAQTLAEVESDWRVEDGALGFSIQQFGKTVEGGFSDWTAEITFDESDGLGAKGHVTVQIAIPSLTVGSVTQQALGPDYFASDTYQTATFDAPIMLTEEGYVADGTLTLRGTEAPVSLPFSLTMDGDTARVEGIATLDRRTFGIGETMTDPGQLGFEVSVTVSLTAVRQSSVSAPDA